MEHIHPVIKMLLRSVLGFNQRQHSSSETENPRIFYSIE